MALEGSLVTLERITPELAQRIIAREERPADNWHAEYPFLDELDPLRLLAASSDTGSHFTMYVIRQNSDLSAVGGIGFFGPPSATGRVEFGFGVVRSVRGRGLASDAVQVALELAARQGARLAAADTSPNNLASQRVLAKTGFAEVGRDESLVYFERSLVTG